MIIDGFPPSTEVARLEDEIASLRAQLAAAQAQLTDERARNVELVAQIVLAQKAEKALGDARWRTEAAESDCKSLMKTIKAMQRELDELRGKTSEEVPSTERA